MHCLPVFGKLELLKKVTGFTWIANRLKPKVGIPSALRREDRRSGKRPLPLEQWLQLRQIGYFF
jgi:hypothetical protein